MSDLISDEPVVTNEAPAVMQRGQDLGEKKSVREQLIECADGAELWMDEDEVAYATLNVKNCQQTLRIKSTTFSLFLTGAYCDLTGLGPSANSLNEAVATLAARAYCGGIKHQPALRFASFDSKLYLDLGTDNWKIVEIDSAGYRVINSSDCPARFIRSKSMRSLPIPALLEECTVKLEDLRALLSIDERDWKLLLLCVAGCLLGPTYPAPVMVLRGEQGSGKSLLLELMRKLIDPNAANLRQLPSNEQSLYVSAAKNAVLIFDNVSRLEPWLSDSFCQIATGSGFAARELYSDAEEMVLNVVRPIWLNGIERFVTKDDLGERTTTINLTTIPPSARRTKAEILEWFSSHHSELLSDLLTIVSTGLRNLDTVEMIDKPRMADFAKFACAAAPSVGWCASDFLSAFNDDKAIEQEDLISNDPLAQAILKILRESAEGTWSGTSAELLKIILKGATDHEKNILPKAPNGLSGKIKRLAPALRSTGVKIDNGTGRLKRNIKLAISNSVPANQDFEVKQISFVPPPSGPLEELAW